jgi:MATE family multidrug resistance protein
VSEIAQRATAEAPSAVRDLLRLAAPMILSRAGMAAMTVVAALMTAHHDASELAALNLAEGTFGRVADICLSAVLSGAVLVAGARASADTPRRLASWRRAVGFSLACGLLGLAVASQAPSILSLMGQAPGLSAHAAPVILTMACGLPAGLVAVAAAVHLEAIGRAMLVTRWMVLANLVNLALGLVLIDGGLGVPALGALGAALTSALVRLGLAVALTASLRAVEGPALFQRSTDKVARGRQLALGGAASGTSAAMHALAIWLTIFAGWLGRLPLAGFASVFTINLPGLVMAFGVGDAIAIRAAGSRDPAQLRGDLTVLLVGLAALAAALMALRGVIGPAWAADPALQDLITSLMPFSALVLCLDGMSLGAFSALRARSDIAMPTVIQIGAMAATPLLGALLAFRFDLGVHGLLYAILATSAARLALLGLRLRPLISETRR